MHRICHKNSIFGLYTEYRYRNNAQMAHTGQYGGSERWQGTVIIENGDWYGKCRLPVVFSMERTGAPLPTAGSLELPRCQQRAAGSLDLVTHPALMNWICLELGHDNVIKWKHFSALLALCAGNSPVIGEFPSQRPLTRSYDVFFDLRPNKRMSGWWFETSLRSL